MSRNSKPFLGILTPKYFCGLLLVGAVSIFAEAQTFKGQREMNGISYSDYEGFEDKWKFVTVRFRQDTGEQRFTWGNELAMKALESGSTDYPDGAVFAKIGFATEKDPDFHSSLVPSGSKRYQFMVRDKKKYASTGGWGYALFDAAKVTFDGDPKTQSQACYACHLLVPQRGQVFSQPLKISAFAAKIEAPLTPKEAPTSAVKFETVAIRKLPEIVRRNLPEGSKTARAVTSEIRNHVFRGTIDEIRPTLIEEVRRTGMAATLVSAKDSQFAAVYPDPDMNRKNCNRKSFKSVFSTQASDYLIVAYQDLCL